MQATTRLHDGPANAIFQEANLVFDQTVAFHTTNRVVDPDADGREGTIGSFCRWGEFPTRGCFLGLDDRDARARIALAPHVLIETAASWEGITRQISPALILRLPVIRGAQDAHVTGLLDHEEVFARMALLRAAV